MAPLFPHGQLAITANARARLDQKDIFDYLGRHLRGDWGELSQPDRELNDQSVKNGGRLLSAYTDQDGIRFWIITEADRSVTTVLLPEDY